MTKVSSAGVLGLVATPVGLLPNPTHEAPQFTASLLAWETSACVPMGIGVQSNAMRAARCLITAAACSCFFIGIAFAVMAKSLSAANAQASSRAVPLR
jgi:hypothetical protein